VRLLATSKRSPYQLRSIDLPAVMRQVATSFAELAAAQQVEIVTEVCGTPPAILADADEIVQIFSNLMTNALFEMRHGGRLGLRVEHDAQALHVTVSDTGRGIPADHLDKIFDPFFTTKDKGTGFGLSVVLRIVKTYGGTIKVESEPGIGSRFMFTLPLG